MAAVEDIGAGAGCAGALGRNVGGNGHVGGKDGLDDLPHGVHQATRGVQLQDDQPGIILFGPAKTPSYVIHGGGANGTFHGQHQGGSAPFLLGQYLP